MSFSAAEVARMTPPRIRLAPLQLGVAVHNVWACGRTNGLEGAGVGFTPELAYADWFARLSSLLDVRVAVRRAFEHEEATRPC